MKPKMSSNLYALRRISTMILALRCTVYQVTPLRKNVTTTLLLGLVLEFPSVRGGARGRGTQLPTPFRKDGRRMWASPRQCQPILQGYLPTPKSLPRTLHHAPPNSTPTKACHHGLAATNAVSTWPSKQDQRDREGLAGSKKR
jgi:hypothetical protein